MSNRAKDVRQELFDKQVEYGFLTIVDCTDQENAEYANRKKNGEALPENVRQYKETRTDRYVDKFYYLKDARLSDAEKHEYLRYMELDRLNTIENILLFFVILSVISIILSLISLAF